MGSTNSSGEDIATTLESSNVEERQSMEMLASLLITQETEASADPITIITLKGFGSRGSHISGEPHHFAVFETLAVSISRPNVTLLVPLCDGACAYFEVCGDMSGCP